MNEMELLVNSLATQKYTRILKEKNFEFNAPHFFIVEDTEGKPLVQIHFQEGPVKEAGVNGVANEDLIVMVLERLMSFQNSDFKCKENEIAIQKLEEALMWLRKRTMAREIRQVEGTSIV